MNLYNELFLEYFESLFFGVLYSIAYGQVFLVLVAFLGSFFFLSQDPLFKASLKEVFSIWKQVGLLNKWPLLTFTIFVALPHRFWVNNTVGVLGTMFITYIAIFLGSTVSLFFWMVLVAFLNLTLTNLIFITLHERSSSFREAFYFVLFGVRNHDFAPRYFFFFFGNPKGKVFEKLVGVIVALTSSASAALLDANNAIMYGDSAGSSFENSNASRNTPFTVEESQAVKEKASMLYKHHHSPMSPLHNFIDPAGAESVRDLLKK